jgi:hypothetical protein
MANVLVAEDGIGIVDWEAAAPDCLPLGDVWYALVDALARARRTSHADALAMLMTGDHGLPAHVADAPATLARTLGLTRDQALAAFHACWLGHAANELRRGQTGGPFLEIVHAIGDGAIDPEDWAWRAGGA